MVRARTGPRPEEVLQAARHVLFVEGEGDEPLDSTVLRTLLRDRVNVAQLGPSYHVASAAEALHAYHPAYYFLIDRDHHDDDLVQRLWDEFPNPDTANLLIWPRRELENYFIDPVYISESQWLNVTADELRATVLRECQSRVYIDTANSVIVSVRETLKQNWVKLFTRKTDFRSRKGALHQLRSLPNFKTRVSEVARLLRGSNLESLFDRRLNEITGGRLKLEFGRGRWLEMLRGKEILPTVVSRCFQVLARGGNALQGRDAQREFMKDLARLPIEEQPEDFRRLAELIQQRVESG